MPGIQNGNWEETGVRLFSVLTTPHTFPGNCKIISKPYSAIMQDINIGFVNGVYPFFMNSNLTLNKLYNMELSKEKM